ncbi:uncharacterized protein LOC141605171 [Silene latifolia]|uniref:uncharacterized protein LOC141605171 n=1 Tax=Silene latifolia TaxID=37657 RepID=UPI003D78056A
MATNQPPQQQPQQPPHNQIQYTLEITIISGKHLKNVNWKTGDLKPYAIFWVDPDHKLTTKSDDSSNTKPVWNQRFSLPITLLSDAVFTLEVFHSKATESPKPFVGSLQVRLSSLPEPDNLTKLRTYDLLRPSGRPQGKIRLKLAIKENIINYQNTPHPTHAGGYYYSSAPPYPYASRSGSPAPGSSYGYYGAFYSQPPTPPVPSVMRSYSDRNMSYGPPSAPVDYSPYEVRSRGGFGTGFGVGAVGGMLGGLALDDGYKYAEQKVGERVEDNYLGGAVAGASTGAGAGGAASSTKDDFSEYHADY